MADRATTIPHRGGTERTGRLMILVKIRRLKQLVLFNPWIRYVIDRPSASLGGW
jgi:hypothetical protein